MPSVTTSTEGEWLPAITINNNNMKEIIKFDCPAGKSIIEEIANQLFKEMISRNQTKASAEFEIEDLSATVKMTIEITL